MPSDQSGKTYPLMIRLSSHSGPSGNKWKSMIEYCVGDGRNEMVSGRRTRLYCYGICKRLHLRRIITTQMPAIGGEQHTCIHESTLLMARVNMSRNGSEFVTSAVLRRAGEETAISVTAVHTWCNNGTAHNGHIGVLASDSSWE